MVKKIKDFILTSLFPFMLKIAILTYSTRSRGGVVHSTYLAENLQKLGNKVKIFALGNEKFYRELNVPYKIFPLKYKNFKERVEKSISTYKKNLEYNYDVFHAQDCISGNAISQISNIKKVRTIHHVDVFENKELRNYQKKSIKLIENRIVVSLFWKNYLKEKYKINSEVIYNGVDSKKFSPKNKGDYFTEKLKLRGKEVFLFIGGIEPRKGVIYLLRAFKKVNRKIPNSVLLIAGTSGIIDYTPYQKKFFDYLNNLNIKQNIKILNAIEEDKLPSLYRTANCFVFPSLREGWGLVAMESLASGIPVVAYDIPPLKEFLNEKNSVLVRKKSVNKLANAMLKIAKDKEFAEKLSKEGRKTALKFTWEKTAKKTYNFYNSIL